MNTEIVVAIIGFCGSVITAGVILVDKRLNRQVNRVRENKDAILTTKSENTIMEKIVPILETRDEHLEAMVDILDSTNTRLKALEVQLKNFEPLLRDRCVYERMLYRMGIEEVNSREELKNFLHEKDE